MQVEKKEKAKPVSTAKQQASVLEPPSTTPKAPPSTAALQASASELPNTGAPPVSEPPSAGAKAPPSTAALEAPTTSTEKQAPPSTATPEAFTTSSEKQAPGSTAAPEAFTTSSEKQGPGSTAAPEASAATPVALVQVPGAEPKSTAAAKASVPEHPALLLKGLGKEEVIPTPTRSEAPGTLVKDLLNRADTADMLGDSLEPPSMGGGAAEGEQDAAEKRKRDLERHARKMRFYRSLTSRGLGFYVEICSISIWIEAKIPPRRFVIWQGGHVKELLISRYLSGARCHIGIILVIINVRSLCSIMSAGDDKSEKLQILFEEWAGSKESWKQSELVLQMRSRHSHKMRGARRWITEREISNKYGSDEIASDIVNRKLNDEQLRKTQVRDHPDLPGRADMRQYLVWDESVESEEHDEVVESLFGLSGSGSDDPDDGARRPSRGRSGRRRSRGRKEKKRRRSTSSPLPTRSSTASRSPSLKTRKTAKTKSSKRHAKSKRCDSAESREAAPSAAESRKQEAARKKAEQKALKEQKKEDEKKAREAKKDQERQEKEEERRKQKEEKEARRQKDRELDNKRRGANRAARLIFWLMFVLVQSQEVNNIANLLLDVGRRKDKAESLWLACILLSLYGLCLQGHLD